MGLELRNGSGGRLVGHFFGRYVDGNGRRICVPLKTAIGDAGGVPASLRQTGSPAFEAARSAALAELDALKASARVKGRDEGLMRHLIQAKTGRTFTDAQLADLPDIMATMKGRKACRSELWRGWRLGVVRDFAGWATGRGLRSVLEVTGETAEEYLAARAQPDREGRGLTDSTLRRVKAVLGAVFDRALPEGVRNPWKGVYVHSRAGSEEVHRRALTPEEVGRLLDAAEADQLIHPLIVTALSTGLRRGDVCRLAWRDVDLAAGVITVRTSKTGARTAIPILTGFRPYLLGWLSEREEGEALLFPAAERMLRENPDGLTWRIKKIFARAFGTPQEAPQAAQDAPERVPLGEVLADVLRAVEGAMMAEGKRAKMVDLLNAYAAGKSYREIQAERRISRGAISGLLHEAQELAGVRFLPDATGARSNIKKQIRELTKQERGIGTRAASLYDWHCLRTSFVTLCLFGPDPLTVDQVKAITGHARVDMILRHYARPGADHVRAQLEAALPARLASGKPNQIEAGPDVGALAAQLRKLSATDRARLARLLK